MKVRRGGPHDFEAMSRVFVAAGQAAWPHILPVDRLGPPERWRGALESADERVAVVVAERSGELVGFAIVRPSGDEDAGPGTGELDGFYTHPSVWGDGVGRELLAEAVRLLRNAGFHDATLWTAEANHRPRRIYETAGWRLDGAVRHRTLHGAEFDELRYRIALRGR